jgi:gliding motility-associated-like protein
MITQSLNIARKMGIHSFKKATLFIFFSAFFFSKLFGGITAVTSPVDATCNGLATGKLQITVMGSTYQLKYYLLAGITGPILDSINWTASTSVEFSNLSAGSYWVRVIEQTTNSEDYANDNISQPAALNGGQIGSNQDLCQGNTPNPLTNIISPSGGYGSWTYNWEYRTDCKGTWNSLGNNSLTYSPPSSLSDTTCYRRVATNSCGTVYSTNIVTLNIAQAPTIGGTIGSNQTICSNTDPAAFTSSLGASGGSGGQYVWQYTTNLSATPGDGNWTDISGSGSVTYDYNTKITTTTKFVRKYYNACAAVYSNPVTVSVYTNIVKGSISNTMTGFCYSPVQTPANPPAFTSVAPTGGNGSWSYVWQERTTATAWGNAGVTTEIYDPNPITKGSFYRRIETNACGTDTTNEYEIKLVNITTSYANADIPPTCFYSTNGQISANPQGNGITPYTYLWTGGATTQVLTNVGKGFYSVTITDNTAPTKCTVFKNVNLSSLSPSITLGGPVNTTNSCPGSPTGSITINGVSPVGTYTYAIKNTATSDTLQQSGNIFTNVAAGTYRVWAIDARGCVNNPSLPVTTTVGLNPLPDQSLSVSDPSTCAGTAVNIVVQNSQTGVNYQLRLDSDNSNVGSSVPGTGGDITFSVNPAISTVYNVYATNTTTTCGAQLTDKANVVVFPSPSPILTSDDADNTFCAGTSVTFTAAGAGITNFDFRVNGVSVQNGASNTYTTASLVNGDIVTVRGTTAAGCSATSAGITNSVNPVVTPTLTSSDADNTFCAGTSVTFTAAGAGITNFDFRVNGVSVQSSASNTYTTTTLANGDIVTIRGTTAAGCSAISAGITNSVNPIPSAPTLTSNDPDNTFCAGTSVTFTAAGAGITNFDFRVNGVSVQSGASNTYTTTTLANGDIVTVRGTTASGCSATSTGITNSVNPVVTPTLTSSDPDNTFCAGTSVTFTAAGAGITNFDFRVNGVSVQSGASNTYTTTTLANGDIVTINGTTAAGCSATSTGITNTINNNPTSGITPNPAITCTNQPLNFNGNPSGGTGIYTHTWSGVGAAYISDITIVNPIFKSPIANNFVLDYTVTDGNGCSNSSSVNITVNLGPDVDAGRDTTLQCNDAKFTLNPKVSNNSGLLWTTSGDGYFDDPLIAQSTYNPGLSDKQKGTVTLYIEAYGNAPCGSKIDSMVLTIPQKLDASIGTQAAFLIGSNTKIQIRLKTKNHSYVQDLQISLLDPDGTDTLTLTNARLRYDNLPPTCNVVNGDIDILYDRSVSTPFDFCNSLVPPKGTYGIEGNWTKLNGKNPAKGGWAILIEDWFHDQIIPVDGEIDSAFITFTDTSVITHKLTTISYNVQTSGTLITEDFPVTYKVPLALQTTCSNSCDARAIVNVNGGKGPYSYLWNNASASTKDTVDLCKGSYTVTVFDALGCSTTANVEVISPDPIVITGINFSNNDTLKCYGATTDITIHATGGSGAIKYTYIGAPAAKDTLPIGTAFTGIGAGTHQFHIFDQNGCSKDTALSIIAPDTIKTTLGKITPVICYGANTGAVIAKASGGTKKYVFILKQSGVGIDTVFTMADSAEFKGIPAGPYTIAVRDTNNCSSPSELTFTILQPALPLTIDSVHFGKITSCALGSDGWAKMFVSNGIVPYSYILRNPTDTIISPNDSIFGIKPRIYSAIVTDKNNCQAIYAKPISITADPAIVYTKFDVNPVSNCFYNPNGSINATLNRTNGDPSNIVVAIDTINGTYHPLNIAPGNDYLFDNLTRGWHKFYAKDAASAGSCIFTDSAFVSSPAPIIVSAKIDFISKTQRRITVTASGGTGTLNFALIDSKRDTVKTYGFSTNNIFDVDSLGVYSILVRDAVNCAIEKPISLVDFTVNVTNIRCKGTNTGKIDIIPGTPGSYTYDLNLGTIQNTSGNFTNLGAGKYKINVFNAAKDVLYTDSALITQPDSILWLLPLTFSDSTNKCAYSMDVTAAMMVRPYGGTGLYTYSNDSITFNNDPNMVFFGQGNHKVYVQDSIGCIVASVPITVKAPNPVVISVVSVVPVKGLTKGSITLKASGPKKPIQFSIDASNWFGNDSTYTFTNLNATTYTFYARNTALCYDTLNFTIPSASNLPVNIIIDTTQMVCSSDKKASITIQITDTASNIGPFRYFVTGFDTATYTSKTQSFSGLGAGLYSIYVEDKNGRVFTKDTVVPGPPPVTIFATVTPDNCSRFSKIGDIGAIRLNVPSVYTNYIFKWSNDSTSNQITNVNSGIYNVTVTYGKGNLCKQTLSYILPADDSLQVSITPVPTVCPGTVNLEAKGAFIYSWYPKGLLSDPTISNPIATVSDTTLFVVKGYDNKDLCYDTTAIRINVYPVMEIYPAPDTVFVPNQGEIQLKANDGFTWYAWTPATFLDNPAVANPYVRPETSTIYIIAGQTLEGCIVSDTVYVMVAERLIIPSGFTPNGDFINDFWEIGHAEEYPDIIVEVFNRAGQKVYTSKGYDAVNKNFTGTRNGRPLPIGTYYYVIFPTKGSEGIRGTVTIVR